MYGSVTSSIRVRMDKRWKYDANDRVTRAAENIDRTVGNQYDASGRLWRIMDPADGVTTYGYDESNPMTTITDARKITY
jgi:YD repeat-containing protein